MVVVVVAQLLLSVILAIRFSLGRTVQAAAVVAHLLAALPPQSDRAVTLLMQRTMWMVKMAPPAIQRPVAQAGQAVTVRAATALAQQAAMAGPVVPRHKAGLLEQLARQAV